MGKNGYLERKQAAIDDAMLKQKYTTGQYMVDTLMVTLNDPDVMGKDTFGKERIKKVVKAWMENYDTYHESMEKSQEADVWQERLDKKLGAILGDELVPFAKRYYWIKQPRYDKGGGKIY